MIGRDENYPVSGHWTAPSTAGVDLRLFNC
jgi:hypothetical protein